MPSRTHTGSLHRHIRVHPLSHTPGRDGTGGHRGFTAYLVCILDAQDLFPKVLEVVEGTLCCDGVDEDKALPVLHVQVPHRSKLLCSGLRMQ